MLLLLLQANLTRLALEVEDIVLLGSHTTTSTTTTSTAAAKSIDGSAHSTHSTSSSTSAKSSSSSGNSSSKGVLHSLVTPMPVQAALISEQLSMLQHRRKEVAR